MVEQRKAARHRLLKSAKTILQDEGVVHDCIVFDLSVRGALIELKDAAAIPPEITLYFGTGNMFHAQCRWQEGKRLGLEFLQPESAEDDVARSLHLIESILGSQPKEALLFVSK